MTTETTGGLGAVVAKLLPSPSPIRFVDDGGEPVDEHGGYRPPPDELLVQAYEAMVLGRRFDAQATALARQGRIAAFPSSVGQEACQAGAALALRPGDWLFPTYRDSGALLSRGVDPLDVLAPVRGHRHCGYDPYAHRCAPMSTPLATQAPHGTGLAVAARWKGTDEVALVLLGDGATSEGDFHEALNFAAVFRAPVVFLVQNNRYAISVPLSQQSAAPSLAYKGIGYGVRAEQVDGNDAVAVLSVLAEAVDHARAGLGPMLVEAHTYRMGPHTSADDPTRYRDEAEVASWRGRDPVERLRAYLRRRGLLDDAAEAAVTARAEALAAGVRAGVAHDAHVAPTDIIDHVYAAAPAFLAEQRAALLSELDAGGEGAR
ncbi:pyruvate dehydrogenase (acetyl-transferring) E1 component subunit alpha [Frankia sp. CNm7]|uniref:Pyruvate dehydrogenase (Acetyl-transferring) E1 component subunit alpha n=1 Tax=Frankia nepalensis TaxID=1836974 RepID=A0A937RF32_9ACTN|nr:pyruvate dehydrogenase (acetyl-transferring) E1 component subunit alpha [Frankia nepalensis]MBL7500397.1 pyruvate dehydrogenase (acetyl-transferring) E1 component subunit alpha [Frankia nepalensis]MBL7508695.1 pyruvate dehydrogenase (acetyl-transferring) E1 component subunit alpha [Frankia nepalensis]MBL7520671.1 pyruvate dehydrogenase (acetyl-transferring) E1 component subunit alpha [Frankia nepalensis]MBL7628857.1 pyruvate dehydrogenase (acetyl-transferring) E1 component subunit alpha [Fra